MTNDEIKASRAICDAATPGPWSIKQGHPRAAGYPGTPQRDTYVHVGSPEDQGNALCNCFLGGPGALHRDSGEILSNAAFIAHARTALPAALDELEAVNAELGQARADRARLLASYNRAILDLTHLYESLGREGWEEGMTESEARDRAHYTLCEYYGDPYPRADRELPPEYLRQSGGAE